MKKKVLTVRMNRRDRKTIRGVLPGASAREVLLTALDIGLRVLSARAAEGTPWAVQSPSPNN